MFENGEAGDVDHVADDTPSLKRCILIGGGGVGSDLSVHADLHRGVEVNLNTPLSRSIAVLFFLFTVLLFSLLVWFTPSLYSRMRGGPCTSCVSYGPWNICIIRWRQ